jgi:hypothetical protein
MLFEQEIYEFTSSPNADNIENEKKRANKWESP